MTAEAAGWGKVRPGLAEAVRPSPLSAVTPPCREWAAVDHPARHAALATPLHLRKALQAVPKPTSVCTGNFV